MSDRWGPVGRRVTETASSQAKRSGHAVIAEGHVALALLVEFPGVSEAMGGKPPSARIAESLEGLATADVPDTCTSEALAWVRELDSTDPAMLDRVAAEGISARFGGVVIALAVGAQPATTSPETPAAPEVAPFDAERTRQVLSERVLGQSEAVEALVRRLILTRTGLDLRPHRPDAVVLLAGPTGVGKTELAKAAADALGYQGPAFIRLDMSEYQNGEMSVARLVGAGPGYVGHGNSAGLLTTRVIEQPHCVILLDEIEKADPEVLTVFLQVFDDGRLTDTLNRTADFGHAVILLTTNLGARAYDRASVGFGADRDTDRPTNPTEAVIAEVRRTLPPELFNRLDEVVVFNPLGLEQIVDIARKVLDGALQRLAERGIHVEADHEVVELVARRGYDPSLGARHVHRAIESDLLVEAAGRGPGRYAVGVVGGELTWS